jgi:cell division septal protein FtsQ
LRIRVVEREPVASVLFSRPPERGGEQRFLVDRQGHVMFPLEPEQLSAPDVAPSYQLPNLLGLAANDLRPGRKLNDERVRGALELINSFNRSSMVGVIQLKQIDLRAPGVLLLLTSDNCQVSFGLGDLEGQLNRWRAIHEHGRSQGRQMISVDLSVTNNVPVRWFETTLPKSRGKNV